MIKYAVCIGILLLSVRLSQKYTQRLEYRLFIERELLSFVVLFSERMRVSLSPISEIASRFNGKILKECGFLEEISSGAPVICAFEKCLPEPIDENFQQTLTDLFSKIGTCNLNTETERTHECIKTLEKRLVFLEDDFNKQKKLISTLGISFALGVIILLL